MSALTSNVNNVTTLKNFIPLQKIGTGSFSSVYKVRRVDDGKIYALKKVKMMSLKERQKQNALNQIQILASLNSESLVCYKQAFFDQNLSLLCIVMQFADQGDLNKAIETQSKKRIPFDQQQIWKAIYDILRGLQILHFHSIMHRDIKSANIFISAGVYKLGDLNVAKINDSNCQLAFTQTGTPNYASPQVWRDQPYDNKSDIWSLGCVIYEMCTFKPPFKGKNLDELYKSVQKGHYYPISKVYSKDLAAFIDICLKKNPFDRLSATELLKSDGLVMKNLQGTSRVQSSNSASAKSSKVIQKLSLPSNIKDLKHQLPQAKYNLPARNYYSEGQLQANNINPLSPFDYDLDKKQANMQTKEVIKASSIPKRLSIKYTENSIIKAGSIGKQRNYSIQSGYIENGFQKEIALLKELTRKYSVPDIYSQRNNIIKTEEKETNNEKKAHTRRLVLSIGQHENPNLKIGRGISIGSQKELGLVVQQKKGFLQPKKYLRNVRSEKIINMTDKKTGLIEKQTKVAISYMQAHPNPQAQQKMNSNYPNPNNQYSDRRNLKLKKISSSPYICQHNARLKLVVNKVRNMGIQQKKLVGKRYLMIAS